MGNNLTSINTAKLLTNFLNKQSINFVTMSSTNVQHPPSSSKTCSAFPNVYLIRHGESEHNALYRAYSEKFPDYVANNVIIKTTLPERADQLDKPHHHHLNSVLSSTKYDILCPDAELTQLGQKQAKHLGEYIRRQRDKNDFHVDLVIASPLQRAIHTAYLAIYELLIKNEKNDSNPTNLQNGNIISSTIPPMLIHPFVAEKLSNLCDVGHRSSESIDRWNLHNFLQFDILKFHGEQWWYDSNGQNSEVWERVHRYRNDPEAEGLITVEVPVPSEQTADQFPDNSTTNQTTIEVKLLPHFLAIEPDAHIDRRVKQFIKWLLSRPEKSIAIVAHCDLLEKISGQRLKNCEMIQLDWNKLNPAYLED